MILLRMVLEGDVKLIWKNEKKEHLQKLENKAPPYSLYLLKFFIFMHPVFLKT